MDVCVKRFVWYRVEAADAIILSEYRKNKTIALNLTYIKPGRNRLTEKKDRIFKCRLNINQTFHQMLSFLMKSASLDLAECYFRRATKKLNLTL